MHAAEGLERALGAAHVSAQQARAALRSGSTPCACLDTLPLPNLLGLGPSPRAPSPRAGAPPRARATAALVRLLPASGGAVAALPPPPPCALPGRLPDRALAFIGPLSPLLTASFPSRATLGLLAATSDQPFANVQGKHKAAAAAQQ